LAALVEEMDETGAFRIGGQRKRQHQAKISPKPDVRAETLSQSEFRNTLEIFDFDPNAPWFGQQGATIEKVSLLNLEGEQLGAVQGGEEVILRVDVLANQRLDSPIIGWLLKNRLGQSLFGDNSYLSYQLTPLTVESGQRFHGTFRFQLPFLPSGDYAVTAAVAEGSQECHVQHHWIDEALFVRVVASHVHFSLVGIPMHDIKLQVG
jgi:lipopolysaccharide transport system ATP-binding protein